MRPTKLTLEKLQDHNPKVKYGYAKELLNIATNNPTLLYPHFDFWVEMTKSNNNILRWTAIDILGKLAPVDKEGKLDHFMDKLVEMVHAGHLITCNHAILALGNIALHKPGKKDKIVDELLIIGNDQFNSEECRNIATGKVLDIFLDLASDLKSNEKVLEFVNQALNNERAATRKRAEKILKRMELV